MAQSITLQGATYQGVPAVDLPKTGGGTARFTDVTPTTAQNVDVGFGKIFFLADGSMGVGTIIDGDNEGYGISNLVGSAIVGVSIAG